MRVLVLNAGSSTLKWTRLDAGDRATLAAGTVAWGSPAVDRRIQQIRDTLAEVGAFDAVGHRIVHGGGRFVAPVVVDAGIRTELGALVELDALHMEPALAAIDAVTATAPSAVQVAAFDTAFHARMPDAAACYALPHEWVERWSLRRFGFHGLSVQYAVDRTSQLLAARPRRLVVCHLGSGCSVTAVADGVSVDTTMGFTPLEGVVMATRSGSVDPGLLLHLLVRCGVPAAELAEALNEHSGLLGLSGISGDLRPVLAAADNGAPRARLAYDGFVHSLCRGIGAMIAALGGIDALVFTGGIGENSARVRRDVAARLAFIGARLGDAAVEDRDRVVSAPGSSVAVLVIHAREDLVILDAVLQLIDPAPESEST